VRLTRPWTLSLFATGVLAIAALLVPGLGRLIGILAIAAALSLGVWSALDRRKKARRWSTIGSLYSLSPREFEQHVAQSFEFLGYSTVLTPRVADQGVDVIASKGTETIAIQCKRYSDHAPNSAVQAVHAGAVHYGCNRALLVCLGGFSNSAVELSSSTSVELIDGEEYADLVQRISPTAQASAVLVPAGRTMVIMILLIALGTGVILLDVTRAVTLSGVLGRAHVSTLGVNRFFIFIGVALCLVGLSKTGRRRRSRRR
jgi:restriction system protein